MADGHSRRTGRVGVACVTHGPGLTNTATALTAARLARSQVVLLAGDTPRTTRHHGQDIAQHPLSDATAGCFVPLRTPATAAEDVGLAFRRARLAPGPVVLNLPTDLQLADAPAHPRLWPSTASIPTLPPLQPATTDLDVLVAALEQASRPLLLAGRGATAARDDLVRVAERLGSWLGTTLLSKDLFAGQAGAVGVVGGFATREARAVLAEVDLVVAFGASLNRFTVADGTVCPEARWIQVDLDPGRFGDVVPLEYAVVADATETARGLARRVGERAIVQPPLPCLPAEPPTGRATGNAPTGVDTRVALALVDEALAPERNVVVGIGHYSGWAALSLRAAPDRGLQLPWQLGSVGLALGFGIGVAVGSPERPTVVVEGDGGLLMNPGELDTLARLDLPVLVLVLDDAAYGAELHLLRAHGLPAGPSRFPRRDLAAMARSLGVRAWRATTDAEVETAMADLLPLDGPALLHVHVDSEVVHDEIFAALQG